MRVPLDWLYEYCEPRSDVRTLATRLALTGTEVERIDHHGVSNVERFVVGQVLERHKHPDADRLSICMVDVGGSSPVQIVCGAPNVAAGQTVGVARPGAIMPGGVELGKAKLRGQTSDGMICSEDELGIGFDHDGIMVLDPGPEPGTPLEQIVPISTDVLVLEITPNRPDCLGIYGVAREVHAATGAPLKPPPWETDPGSFGELAGVEIVNEAGPELNPRFTARIFDSVTIAPSPRWLRARLIAAGQRPISNVVDISNYVMLLTGHPMHAFDLDKVAGAKLTVRKAKPKETVETLDGQTRTLDEQMLVIEDAEGPTSIAGVMGGARSEVSEDTTSVLSEVASWNGPNVHRTSLKLGLRSEASGRFEKGLQPEQAIWAQTVATQMFIEICGARVRAGTIDLGGPGPAPAVLNLRPERVETLLGTAVPRESLTKVLNSLGFKTADNNASLDVTVPDFRRADVTREIDLIEEVARLTVLETLPATLPARRQAVGALTDTRRLRRRASDLIAGQGIYEIVGWSFTAGDQQSKLRIADQQTLQLQNPMSNEQALMRTTLIGSLLDNAEYNRDQGATRIRLFEAGAVYVPVKGEQLPEEPHHLATVLIGPVRVTSWREPNPPPADFFAAKGALQTLLDGIGVDWTLTPAVSGAPYLHPGRCATVTAGGSEIGWLGEIHPIVAAQWGFDSGPVAAFEIDLDALPLPEFAQYAEVGTFPDVREDLAVVVEDTVSAAQVIETITEAGVPLLASADVFDVYRDPQRLGEGKVSLAVRLTYRAADRTLTDEEVAGKRQRIVNALEQQLGGKLRDQ
jgi:phenylalanyl-tRNA synthetase beta chain